MPSTTVAYRPCTALTHYILWLSSELSAKCAVLIHYATVVLVCLKRPFFLPACVLVTKEMVRHMPPADNWRLGRVCKRLQPEQDHADVDHGEIVVATLLIPRSDAPGLLEAVDQPLDFVA